MKSQIENAGEEEWEDGESNSQVKNAGEQVMGRAGWRGERGLKSQIENAVEKRTGRRRGWTVDNRLKFHFENAREDGMVRAG